MKVAMMIKATGEKENSRKGREQKSVKGRRSKRSEEDARRIVLAAQEKIDMKMLLAKKNSLLMRIGGGVAVIAVLAAIVVVILTNQETKNVIISIIDEEGAGDSGNNKNTPPPARESFASVIVIGVCVTFVVTGIVALLFLFTGASSAVKRVLGSGLLSSLLGLFLLTGLAISLVAIITNEQSVPLRMAGAFLILQSLLLYGFRFFLKRVVFEDEFLKQLEGIKMLLDSNELNWGEKNEVYKIVVGKDEVKLKNVLDALSQQNDDDKINKIKEFLSPKPVQPKGFFDNVISKVKETVVNKMPDPLGNASKALSSIHESTFSKLDPIISFFTGRKNYGDTPEKKFMNQMQEALKFIDYEKSRGKWGLKFWSAQKLDTQWGEITTTKIPVIPKPPQNLSGKLSFYY